MTTSPTPPAVAPPDIGQANIVDVFLQSYSNVQKLQSPLALEPPPAYFQSVSNFCELTCQASLEMFREEIEHQVRLCGSFHKEEHNPPHEQQPHARIRNPVVNSIEWREEEDEGGEGDGDGDGIGIVSIGPYENLSKYPEDNPKASFNSFAVLIQIMSSDRRGSEDKVEHVCLALCESLSKKRDGVVLRTAMAKHLVKKVGEASCMYIRKVKNFGFMSLQPLAALQKIAMQTPTLSDTSVAYRLFLRDDGDETGSGGVKKLQMFPKVDQLDEWIAIQNEKSLSSSLLDMNKFNTMQQRALALAGCINEGVALIQGPPGTGKSHLIAHGLLPSLLENGSKGVLVVCQSNCAVDSIAQKAIHPTCTIKDRVIRVGFKNKIAPSVLAAGVFREKVDEVFNGDFGASSKHSVLFTTLYNACSEKFTSLAAGQFDTLILDEAAQVEDMKLFALLVGLGDTVRKVILVGDHKQLQPYVSDGVRKQGYGVSTMERLINHYEHGSSEKNGIAGGRVVHIMLEAQHRMPTPVRSIVSDLYYGSNLLDGPNIRADRALQTSMGVQMPAIIAFDLVFGSANFDVFQRSLENLQEADVSSMIYEFIEKELRKSDGSPLDVRDICILSPFNRHKNRLRTVVAGLSEDLWHKFEQSMDSTDSTSDFEAKIRNIDTVDKFQGSEREVVMINTVAESAGGEGSRARDPHFINVAMSRCKSLLVLVGHLSSIGQKDVAWKQIVDHAESNTGCKLFVCNGVGDVESALCEMMGKRRRKE